jgi:hypothetical protein
MACNLICVTRQRLLSAAVILAGCVSAVASEAPKLQPLSFKYGDGEPAEITISRYSQLPAGEWSCVPDTVVCSVRTQQAQVAPVQGQVSVYCSFLMGPANPAAYEANQPTGYQMVTLGQTTAGRFMPAIRFGMVDDDRASGKGMASYVPGVYDGAIEYYGMYARPETTYDFRLNLDLSKGRATVWVAGRGDDAWFPVANNVPLMNSITAVNAVRVDQLAKAPGIENLVIQSQLWAAGEQVRPHPLAKKDRIVGPEKGFRFQPMKSLWRDARRHVTVARTPNTQTPNKKMGWWLGLPDITQTGPATLVAIYVDGAQHAGGGQLWAKHSSDLGKTWGDPVVIYPGPTNSPHVQTLRDGSLLALADIYEPLYPNVFFRSTDGGHSWTQVGRLDPIAAGGPESCVPSRIVELADGSWLLVNSHTPGQAWHLTEGETLEFYRSADRGKTWSHYSTLKPPYPLSLSEASIVPLPDGRWLLFAREGGEFPGVRAYSSDQGKTWNVPEELPFTVIGRTCASLLKDGRVLLTFRNHSGLNDLWAWVAMPDEPLPPLVHGVHMNDGGSVGLKSDGLYIDSDGRCGQFTNYRFRPPDSVESHIEVTVEVKVLSNAGHAAALSVPFVGKIQFYPDKVRLMHDSTAEIAVSAGDFHTYRIVSEGAKMTLFIDGREALARDNLQRRIVPQAWSAQKFSLYPLEFGNEPADDATAAFDWVPGSVREQSPQPESSAKASTRATPKTITPAVTGCSIWRCFTARFDDPKTGVRTVSWSADGGEFPDQYQLDRIIEIDGTIAGWDQGYSGWAQFEDGRILILNYTDDTARFNRTYPDGGASWIRGSFMTPDELPTNYPLHSK